MGENSAKLDPAPFHDVVAGNNLYFNAATGWDSATGLGSMDAAAMDAAWIRYLEGGGALRNEDPIAPRAPDGAQPARQVRAQQARSGSHARTAALSGPRGRSAGAPE